MVAVIEQENPSIEKHHHFFPIMDDNIYNCEFCGVRIALLQVENEHQEQFKLCGTCLKEYIDQEAAENDRAKREGNNN
jgi:hypothetical protein